MEKDPRIEKVQMVINCLYNDPEKDKKIKDLQLDWYSLYYLNGDKRSSVYIRHIDPHGYFVVQVGNVHSYFTSNGNLVIPYWFDGEGDWNGNVCVVTADKKYNAITRDIELVWNKPFNEWFDWLSIEDLNGTKYIQVGFKSEEHTCSKSNFLAPKADATLLSKEWFDNDTTTCSEQDTRRQILLLKKYGHWHEAYFNEEGMLVLD